jgi:hypothetical protein
VLKAAELADHLTRGVADIGGTRRPRGARAVGFLKNRYVSKEE